jgi:predicted methyltransferase
VASPFAYRRGFHRLVVVPGLLFLSCLGEARAQNTAAPPAGINKPFENPDVAGSIKRFESESREVYTARNAIVEALGLRPGMAVADVGAGTGLFTRLVAARVGTEGKVYAVDIAPAFLKHIAVESKKLGQPQVHTLRGTQSTTNLPPESIDLAFMIDVYHHVEHPPQLLASIQRALRPGGRFVLVEFDRTEKSAEFVRNHVRADQATFVAEVEKAGFARVENPKAPRLKENFFAEFRKLDRAGAAPSRPAGKAKTPAPPR